MLAACEVANADPYIVGGLQFCGDFSPNSNGMLSADSTQTNVETLVGFVTENAEPFQPLLQIVGRVTIPPESSGITMFSIGQTVTHDPSQIKLRHVLSNPVIWSISFDVQSFDANQITGDTPGGAPLTSGTPTGLSVAGIPTGFLTNKLLFFNPGGPDSDTTDAQTRLQGEISFNKVGFSALTVGVDGTNYVEIAADTGQITLTGVNASIKVPNFSLGGVQIQSSLGVSYTSANEEFGFQGEGKFQATGLKSGSDSSMVDVKIGAPGLPGLVVSNGSIESFDLTITNSTIKAWELLVEPRNLTFKYNTNPNSMFPDSFVIFGDIDVKIPNGQASSDGKYTTISGDFGTMSAPGIAINTESGVVESVNIGVSGDLNLLGFQLNISHNNPGRFSYDGTNKVYGLSGQLTAPQLWNAEVIAGTSNTTGIQIENGNWKIDNLSIEFSDVSLGAFKVKELEVTLEQFQAMTVVGDITTGSNTVINASSSGKLSDSQPGQPITGPGVPANTKLSSASSTTLTLSKNATQTATAASFSLDNGLDLAFDLFVVFPGGWEVDGEIDMLFDETQHRFEINEVFLKWQATNQASRVPIGDTGLFLTEIDATVQNATTSDIVVSGDVTVDYGDEVQFIGKKATLFSATGGFTVDKDHLEIDATVYWGSFLSTGGKPTGLLGQGTGELLLDWNDREYLLDVKSSLYKGVFTFEEKIQFDAGQGILLFAEADVNVPHGIPFIGGKKLGSLDFMFKYEIPDKEDNGQAQGFVAAWTDINLIFKKVEIGIEYDFENEQVKVIGKGGIKSDLAAKSQDPSKPYTYEQSFTVPASGATQGTLTADWTRAFPSGTKLTNPSVTVVGEGWQSVGEGAFSSSNGLTLLPPPVGGSIKQVGMVGSSSNEFTTLPVQPNKDYTLKLTVTSDTPPRKDTEKVVSITSFENPDSSKSTLLTLKTLPNDLRQGDVLTLSGSTVSAYNTNHTVVEITSSGQVVSNQVWSADDASGKAIVSNWYVPQFHSTFHIPKTVFAATDPITIDETGRVNMNVSIASLASLQSGTTFEVYVDVYDPSASVQDFRGVPVAKNVALSSALGSSLSQVTKSASTTIDLTQLNPSFQYYIYAVVDDGTNPAATSPASAPFQVSAALDGQVLDVPPGETSGKGLPGWTVFVDENSNGVLDPGEIHTTTINAGSFAFLPSQTESLPIAQITQDISSGNALVSFNRTATHGLRVGSTLTVSDSTGYDGTFNVTDVLSSSRVVIDTSYTADSVGGTAISSTKFPTGAEDVVLELLDDNYVYDQPTDGKQPFTYDGSNSQVIDFLVNETSAIKGKLTGADGNPLTGWAIFLDENGSGQWDPNEPFQITGSGGQYSFSNPAAGTYTVALAIRTGAVGNYTFDGTTGTTIVDSSGGGQVHTGTLTNGATRDTAANFGIENHPRASANNEVVRFDGTNQFVDFNQTDEFEPGTASFSFASWIRVDDPTVTQAIAGSADSSAAADGWMLMLSNDQHARQLYVYLAEDSSQPNQPDTLELFAEPQLAANTWYHVAFTFDGTNSDEAVTIYVNGVAQTATVVRNTLSSSPDISNENAVNFNIGGQGSSATAPNSASLFSGYQDHVSLWDTDLSLEQVQAHYLGATIPGYVQVAPVNPGTYSVTIDDSGTDVEAGNDFSVEEYAAVSGKVDVVNSSTVGSFNKEGGVGGGTGSSQWLGQGQYTVSGSHNLNNTPTTDAFYFRYQPIAGDGVIVAAVESVSDGLVGNKTPNAKGGVMFRSSTNASSPYAAIWMRPNNQVAFAYRDAANSVASTATFVGDTTNPKWVRLERDGDQFTASYSTDGVSWTVIGTHTTKLLDTSLAGMFAASGMAGVTSRAVFSNVSYTSLVPPDQQGEINVIQDDKTVATSELFGDGSYLVPSLAPGTYEVQQIPPDGTVQSSPFYNDVTFTNQQFNSPNAVKMTEVTTGDFDADGNTDVAFLNQSNNQITLAYGAGDGTFTDAQAYSAGNNIKPSRIVSQTGTKADVFVSDENTGQIVRLSNALGGRSSQFKAPVVSDLLPTGTTAIDLEIGDFSTVGFFHSSANIGKPAIEGTVSVENGKYSVSGSGAGITGTSDSFFYAFTEMTGDGQFEVLMDLVANPIAYGIGGLMLRDGTATNDPFGMILMGTYNWTIAAQDRSTKGAGATNPGWGAGGQDYATYMRITRSGNSVTGAWLSHEHGWLDLGRATIDLPETFQVGIAVANADETKNHQNYAPNTLVTATFHQLTSSFKQANQQVAVSFSDSTGATNGFAVIEMPYSSSGTPRKLYQSENLLYGGELVTTDVNNDGNLDIVLNGGNSRNEITVAYGNGKGGFSVFAVPLDVTFTNGGTVEVTDVNGDQRPDIVLASSDSGELVAALQDEGGGFPLSTLVTRTTTNNAPAASLVIHDFNGDGRPDLVALPVDGQNSRVDLFINGLIPGQLYAATPISYDAFHGATASTPVRDMTSADFNNDKTLDLFVLPDNAAFAGLMLSNKLHAEFETIPVDLQAGQLLVENDFTDSAIANVSGTIYQDTNGDGVIDASDTRQAGATAYLDMDNDGQLSDGDLETLTDADGTYQFDNLADGSYRLGVMPIPGFFLDPSQSFDFFYTVVVENGSETGGLDFLVRPNDPPAISTISHVNADGNTAHVIQGKEFLLSAVFRDLEFLRGHAARIDWGDGTISQGVVAQTGGLSKVVTASHVYDAGGYYDIALTVQDDSDSRVAGAGTYHVAITGSAIRDRVLHVVGTHLDDSITLTQTGGRLRVSAGFLADAPKSFDVAAFDEVKVTPLLGEDKLTIGGNVHVPVTLDADAEVVSQPFVRIDSVTPDSQIGPIDQIYFDFSERIQGFELSDLSLQLNGREVALASGATLTSRDGIVWTLSNLGAITERPGRYAVTLESAKAGITSLAGVPVVNDAVDFWDNVVTVGDANFDGVFDSSDLVHVMQRAKFRTGELAIWSEGDWNDDHVFDESDLLNALEDGDYERRQPTPRPAKHAAAILGLGRDEDRRQAASKNDEEEHIDARDAVFAELLPPA